MAASRIPSQARPLAKPSVAFGLLALLVTVLVAGCGGSSKPQHRRPTSTNVTRPTGAPEKGIASATYYAWGGLDSYEQVHVTLYDIRREGPFVVVDYGVVCPSGSCSTTQFLTPTASTSPPAPAFGIGLRLVDPVANKEYWPLTDSQGNVDASNLGDLNDTHLHLAWTKFVAPPSSTRTMDVIFPDIGPQIPAAPISTGPPPVASQLGRNVVPPTPQPFAYPPGSTSTAGLDVATAVENLSATVGNPRGSDNESSGHSILTLNTDVLFRFDKSNLTPTARSILGSVAPKIKSRAVGTVQVTGYTDSIGPNSVNLPLSRARAASVVAALKPLTPGITYSSTGDGAADPVAPNTLPDGKDNPAGRALNRRVTISFAAKTPAAPSPPASVATVAQPQAGATSRTTTFARTNPTLGPSGTYTVAADQLFREGNDLVLKLTITCAKTTGDCDTETDLNGTRAVPPVPGWVATNPQPDTTGGFYLRDPASGTEYIPLYNAGNAALASPIGAGVPAGHGLSVWLYYPAPPRSVSSVDVMMPGGLGRIANVPVSPAP